MGKTHDPMRMDIYEKASNKGLHPWNHQDNHDERTNNRVEGDNNKMKNFCGAADPNIDKAAGLLQMYELDARDKYLNAKLKNARAPFQKADVAMRGGNFYPLGIVKFNIRVSVSIQ